MLHDEVHSSRGNQCAPRAGKVAGASRDESHGQSTPQDSQRALLPEAMHQRRHPPLIAQRATQVPEQAHDSRNCSGNMHMSCTASTLPTAHMLATPFSACLQDHG